MIDPADETRIGDPETAEDLYHRAPCGYLSLQPDGTVVRVNDTFLRWTGYAADDLVGERRFADLLTAGGRIYHETHFAPLLLMQDEVREVALDLRRADGTVLPVLVNGLLLRDAGGDPLVIRITAFDATVRRGYEQELQRARRAAEQSEREVRAVAETLQRSMLQRTDLTSPAFRVETRYRPAVDSLEVGGDWHDAFFVDGERAVGISVGDVVGKGIDAACAMGQVRSALRALARSGAGPSALLHEVDRFVQTVPDAFSSTIVYAELDLEARQLRYAAAGHPPPVLIHADGTGELLWGGRSAPVGTIGPDRTRPEGVAAVEPGDRVLLYTDGLCERRDRSPDDGFALIVEHGVRLRDLPIDAMADELMAAMLGADHLRDDTCLLVLEVCDAAD
ncbi:PP2C family protein-serine/threonine phosphatase [Aquihabitans daechungensis]|uniref:PP2C family protein-serine/threonine phosphatase n=1 Tax=Aquihabitans daechungensis TaxID=1052257 RepID=UPI003BA24CA4